MNLIRMLAEINHAGALSSLEIIDRFGWIRYLLLLTIWHSYVYVDPVSYRFKLSRYGVDLLNRVEAIIWPDSLVRIEPDTFAIDAIRSALAEAAYVIYPEAQYPPDECQWAAQFALDRAWAADYAEDVLNKLDRYENLDEMVKFYEVVRKELPVIYAIGSAGLWI